LSALALSYYGGGGDGGGPGWDGVPMYDGPPMMPLPPDYGRVIRSGDYAGATTGSGAYGANQMNPSYYRRGTGGSDVRRGGVGSRGRGRGGGMPGRGVMMPPGGGGPMGGNNPFFNAESLRDSSVAWSGPPPGPYFGRDNAIGRQSLKDMAARSSKSYDAEVIRSMNNRNNARRAALGGGEGGGVGVGVGGISSFPVEAGGERRQTTTSTTSTSSQYVPLSSIYGPPRSASPMDRSPPLSGGPPPPLLRQPIIDTHAMAMGGELPQSIHTARTVRPSVVLVTSEGVRKENSQGSGFVVAFDDSTSGGDDDDDDDDPMKDRVHILTSAHVAPPGWKVSVTFPGDPDKQYPATVVGRKLNSDLALLCVEAAADENDDYPFPPPLVLTGEDVSTDTFRVDDYRVPTSEIGSPVYAFGYPMGVEGPTMTSGILSATTKGINYMDAPTGEEPSEISKSRPFEKTSFVITDAAMAGGMSGGPLVNNEGIVLGINALVRPDLRALGNYAVSALECEIFLEKLEDKRSKDAAKSGAVKRVNSRRVKGDERSGKMAELQQTASTEMDSGVAGFRVMLYGYSSNKPEATKVLRRIAGLDELRAENAMRSAQSFGAGVVDEFYVAESGGRERAIKAARKSADELSEKLKEEGMMVEVEPLNLLK
jgi:S1-C subfamily serine protease